MTYYPDREPRQVTPAEVMNSYGVVSEEGTGDFQQIHSAGVGYVAAMGMATTEMSSSTRVAVAYAQFQPEITLDTAALQDLAVTFPIWVAAEYLEKRRDIGYLTQWYKAVVEFAWMHMNDVHSVAECTGSDGCVNADDDQDVRNTLCPAKFLVGFLESDLKDTTFSADIYQGKNPLFGKEMAFAKSKVCSELGIRPRSHMQMLETLYLDQYEKRFPAPR